MDEMRPPSAIFEAYNVRVIISIHLEEMLLKVSLTIISLGTGKTLKLWNGSASLTW